MSRCHATSIALWLMLHVGSSSAAPSSPEPGSGSRTDRTHENATVSTQSVDHESSEDVDALFAGAQERYAAGDLVGALHDLEKCYARTHSVNLLFNLAQLYSEMSDCPKALEHYRRYVQGAPEGERRVEAEQHIANLSQRCPVESPKKPPANVVTPETVNGTSPAAAPEPAPSWSRPWLTVGWIALGTGAVAAAASAVFSVEAVQARRDTERRQITADLYNERSADLYRDSAFAVAFGATALVAVGVGVYALVAASPKEPTKPGALSIDFLRDGALLAYRARF